MQGDLKPLVVSALVFPGLGQYMVGRKALALLFAVPTLVAAGYFFHSAMVPAMVIADDINRGLMPFDIGLIVQRLRAEQLVSPGVHLATWVIVGAWAGSVAELWLRREKRA